VGAEQHVGFGPKPVLDVPSEGTAFGLPDLVGTKRDHLVQGEQRVLGHEISPSSSGTSQPYLREDRES
jgi:hypothetical protein